MIARLTGTVYKNDLNSIIINVNGVGYLVNCSNKTMEKVSDGESISMDIETIVREDSIKLFGFSSTKEKYWFNTLATVQGVGFKVCISILNVLSPDDLTAAIMSGDKALITRADGVGPKLAGRIILELKDKVSDLSISPTIANSIVTESETNKSADVNDAISALINLGYNRAKAFMAVKAIKEYSDLNDLIKKSLKELTS
ncbi:MAG: Holliday junction branch migration protein RuvA [Alphaproteobacteria bacterium]|nr:Holliday junction branch migration protein RuvA [Alphaproteobacteria bacterium]